MSIEHLNTLLDQLDLSAHTDSFKTFFSRSKPLFIEGDQERHYKFIGALDNIEFKSPPKVEDFDTSLIYLQKRGVLNFDQINNILKVIRYFSYFKNMQLPPILNEWFLKIEIPPVFFEIDNYFDNDGNFNESKDETLLRLNLQVKTLKSEIGASLKRLMFSQKIAPLLVDTQVHYINDEESLLVRGGFNHVLKGAVIGRSSGGFFYVSPDVILKTKEQIRFINQEREALFYAYAKKFSESLYAFVPFIKFIDREFDKLDHYQARVSFARYKNFEILKTTPKNSLIVIKNFKHPALHNAKSVDINFSKNVLMITGVNAGGKTMLLKSILSATLMAKYLIPMSIDKNNSVIGTFKHIQAVIDDPQNVNNDISTFAGRMLQFSKLFDSHDALIGVDEIELGTDSDEAAALFKVILDDLIERKMKVVVTTHHKRLAALMADRDDVELIAAIYDEERRLPTYEFLQGIIGKSYAFETALRYGIKSGIVSRAKEVYGSNHEKLNQLIERGSELERDLKRKNSLLDEKLESVKNRELELKEARANLLLELQEEKNRLRASFDEAINEAKRAAKLNDTATIHREMNKAFNKLPKENEVIKVDLEHIFSVGESVKYRRERGVIISLKAKDAIIEVEGIRVRVRLSDLKPTSALPKKLPKVDVKNSTEKKGGLKLDLHGLYAEEALEKLDTFLSDALLNNFDEVIIYHGIGTGKLAYAVKNFLKSHPSVIKFEDAPAHMGGFGAKIVTL